MPLTSLSALSTQEKRFDNVEILSNKFTNLYIGRNIALEKMIRPNWIK